MAPKDAILNTMSKIQLISHAEFALYLTFLDLNLYFSQLL